MATPASACAELEKDTMIRITDSSNDFSERRFLQIHQGIVTVRHHGDNENFHLDRIRDITIQSEGHAAPDAMRRCTGYNKKRRSLREHRVNMRIMDDVIEDHGLAGELENRLVDETGNTNFWLGIDSEMDEDSDQYDPQAIAEARASARLVQSDDKKSFIDAVQGALENRATATLLERSRMRLEDLLGQIMRHGC